MTGLPSVVDLHTHSTASDGLLAPAALVRLAAERGLRTMALTDHDTLAGLPEAAATAADLGIDLIPGVELSAESGPNEVHILGYLVDPGDAVFAAALTGEAAARRVRAERITARLGQLGYPIEESRIYELAAGGTIGRPHVARAMIEAGYVATIAEAFDRFLANGRPAFVAREKSVPEDAVDLILRAGGVAVLAHPYSTGDIEGTLARLVPHGLGGIEVYYGEYGPDRHLALRAIADAWELVPTGGSDYHGPKVREGRELGAAPVPAETPDRLRARHDTARAR